MQTGLSLRDEVLDNGKRYCTNVITIVCSYWLRYVLYQSRLQHFNETCISDCTANLVQCSQKIQLLGSVRDSLGEVLTACDIKLFTRLGKLGNLCQFTCTSICVMTVSAYARSLDNILWGQRTGVSPRRKRRKRLNLVISTVILSAIQPYTQPAGVFNHWQPQLLHLPLGKNRGYIPAVSGLLPRKWHWNGMPAFSQELLFCLIIRGQNITQAFRISLVYQVQRFHCFTICI